MAHLQLSPDGMRAELVLEEGERIEPLAARALLRAEGVVAGLQEEALEALSTLIGPADYVVALGALPQRGENASVKLLFPAGSQELTPTIGEDGRADFRNLGLVCNVAAGDLLVEKVPATAGAPGYTVLGAPLVGAPGRDLPLLAGDGATLSEDGLTIRAAIAGSPALAGKKVIVRKVFTVTSDVDLSTGHVRFDGDLEIRGSVQLQMEVEASGNVTIHGNVEGASVRAGGRLVVQGGVRHHARLEAGLDAVAKFIEQSSVRCSGSLGVREDLLYSEVVTPRSLLVGGSIVGGSHHVGERVEAKTLGNRLGSATPLVLVSVDPAALARQALATELEALHQNQMRVGTRLRETQQLLRDPAKAAAIGEAYAKLSELVEQLAAREAELVAELAELEAVPPPPRPKLVVRETIHPGVSVQIGHALTRFSTVGAPGTLIEEGGGIRLIPL